MSNLPENQEPQDVEIQVGAAIMFTLIEGGAFFLAMSLGWLFSIPTLDVIHWNWQGVWLGLAATVPMLVFFVLCRFAPWRPFRHLTRLVRHLLIPPLRTCRPHEIVIISGLAGLGEELLFRGILQGGAFLLLVKWLDPTTSIILAVRSRVCICVSPPCWVSTWAFCGFGPTTCWSRSSPTPLTT